MIFLCGWCAAVCVGNVLVGLVLGCGVGDIGRLVYCVEVCSCVGMHGCGVRVCGGVGVCDIGVCGCAVGVWCGSQACVPWALHSLLSGVSGGKCGQSWCGRCGVSVELCGGTCLCSGGGGSRRVWARVSLLFRQSPGEDMKFKKKINFHSTCADCVKGRWGCRVRDEGAGGGL